MSVFPLVRWTTVLFLTYLPKIASLQRLISHIQNVFGKFALCGCIFVHTRSTNTPLKWNDVLLTEANYKMCTQGDSVVVKVTVTKLILYQLSKCDHKSTFSILFFKFTLLIRTFIIQTPIIVDNSSINYWVWV